MRSGAAVRVVLGMPCLSFSSISPGGKNSLHHVRKLNAALPGTKERRGWHFADAGKDRRADKNLRVKVCVIPKSSQTMPPAKTPRSLPEAQVRANPVPSLNWGLSSAEPGIYAGHPQGLKVY